MVGCCGLLTGTQRRNHMVNIDCEKQPSTVTHDLLLHETLNVRVTRSALASPRNDKQRHDFTAISIKNYETLARNKRQNPKKKYEMVHTCTDTYTHTHSQPLCIVSSSMNEIVSAVSAWY